MPDPALIATLKRLEEHLGCAIHEHTRQRTAVRDALTRLRMGESPALVAARLAATCPELHEEVGR